MEVINKIIMNNSLINDNSDNDFLNMIYESIENEEFINDNSLLIESALCIDKYTNYYTLIEAVDELHEIDKESKNMESDTDSKNCVKKGISLLKRLFNWWYKEEPDKKYKTLRLILKISLQILSLVIGIWGPGKAKIASRLMTGNTGKAIRKISYKGSSKILKSLFSDVQIATKLVQVGYAQMFIFLNKADDKIYETVNMENIDASIKEYDKSIDKINDILDKTESEILRKELVKNKKYLEDSLAALIKIRDKKIKKK